MLLDNKSATRLLLIRVLHTKVVKVDFVEVKQIFILDFLPQNSCPKSTDVKQKDPANKYP